MGKIVILDENTANQIAAGEVIERPASIVKEMVENALDAGATAITADIENGGIKSIRITDNGDGIAADDIEMAFERHATSKIRRIEDLNRLTSMGFRGEALASIASVAKVEVVTRTEGEASGTKVIVEAGSVVSSEPTGAPKGTTFTVRELFYNTPARYKFLKKDATEAGYIEDILIRIALARPDVSLKLINQGRTVLHTPGNHDLLSTIYSLYGKDIARAVLPVNATGEGLEITGFIGKPEITRGNRGFQSILVNGRFIHNRVITAALEEAYKTKLMQKRFPFAVLKLSLSPQFVDVNVHPAKLEVRFSDEQKVFRAVFHAVSEALSGASLIPKVEETQKHFASPADQILALEQIQMQNRQSGQGQIKVQAVQSRNPTPTPTRNPYTGNTTDGVLTVEKNRVNIEEFPAGKTYDQSQHTPPEVLREPEIENSPNTPKAAAPSAIAQETPANDRERLLHARILGQAFESYILLEEGEELFLVDQHAAHERIRFEEIRHRFTARESFSQGLLIPLAVNLSETEMVSFHELEGYFEKLGFEIEDFGNRTVLVRGIPYLLTHGFSGQDFLDILEKLSREVSTVSEIIPEETLYMMACKSAIKAKRTMSPMELQALIQELIKTQNPYTCVHGRPVIISMQKKELEKRFKRIV